MEVGKWKMAQRWRHFKRPADSRGMWKQFVENAKEPIPMAEGGVPQLVQPGPGRLGLDKGGMAKVLSYLDNVEPGTELSMNDIMKVAGENKWNVSRANLYSVLNNPEKKQIAASGNEVFVHGEDKRNLIKKINQKIKLKEKFKQSPNEDLFKQIDIMIADKKKYPDLKAIGEELGYKPTKKGQGGNLRLNNPLMQEWQKSRGRNLILEMRFKEYKLTKDSPWVKKVIELRKELGSTRATAKKLKVDRKTIRNITEQFAPNMFGDVNLRKSDKWNYKAVRAKRERELIKRLGGKDNVAVQQYMNLWDDVVDMNEDILRMSDDAIWKNERIRQSMNFDITGLKSGDPITFDRYEEFLADGKKNPKYLNKKQFAAKVKDMASKNGFYKAEHSIPIASEKLSAGFPKNLQVASGKIGDQLEAIKLYIKNNPDGKHIPALNEFLDEFDIQIREGGKTYGWNNPKDKAGLNVYRPENYSSDIVDSAWTKSQTGKINNPNLRIIPKFTPKISGAGELYSFPANLPKMFKMMGSGTRKALGWVTGGALETWFYNLDKKNEMSKGKSEEEAAAIALENATFGATSSISKRKYIEHLEKVAEDMGIDPRAFESVYKMNEFQANIQDTLTNYNESIKRAKDEGRTDHAKKLENIMNKFFDDKQAELHKMAETVAGQVSISKTKLPKPSLDQIAEARYNVSDMDFLRPLAEIKLVAHEKLKREKQSKWEDISQRSDTEAGDKGDWLNANIFNLQSLPRATKWWVDTINPFTPLPEKDAWMSDYEKERRALKDMTSEERKIYNREKRGLTYESPISEEAKENLKMRHPGLGYGLSKGGRVSYLDGGIVSLLKK